MCLFFVAVLMYFRTMDRRLALAANDSSNGGDNPNDTSTVTSTSLLLLEKDVFVCSELERASSCLASVDGSLATLLHHINTAVSATSTGTLFLMNVCVPDFPFPCVFLSFFALLKGLLFSVSHCFVHLYSPNLYF